ncbi:phosphoribosylamine--glycine ligase [soil metagenome]
MRVLIVGSGGREHALAWKVAQSPRLTELFVAPGNAGTAPYNIEIAAHETAKLVAFATERKIELVIVGSEVPLAAGLADAFTNAGIKAFGPSQAAAEIESSKVFSKEFMVRHGIPTARFAAFTDYDTACAHVAEIEYSVVIKASGLAAGKGVVMTASTGEAMSALKAIMLDHEFGSAGDEVIIEERLSGEEVSLLCFSDGVTVATMPPAQDHKRLLDGDRGPNTGGMGAYAPAPVCPRELADEFSRTVLQPVVDGLRAEGRPFIGILYAGLMLTPTGPRVLEFNCRFGDPETQVLLPLLDSDLLTVAEACVDGRLADTEVKWSSGAAACVVVAAGGYPGAYVNGRTITGLDGSFDHAVVFHAGTKRVADETTTAGGRVLAITGWDATIAESLQHAYAPLKVIDFEGMQFRNDIGWRAVG